MDREVRIGPDAEGVSALAADLFVSTIRPCTERAEKVSVALSGGKTPRRMYELLAAAPRREQLCWSRLHFFWVDERPVPPDDDQSNFHMVQQTLLAPLGISASRIHRIRAECPDLNDAAAAYEAEMRCFFALAEGSPPPAFDLVFLGMGSDGHTASLFPKTQALWEQRRWVVANWVPQLSSWRITVTYPVLNAASRVAFLVSGAEKARAVARALAEGTPLDECPAAGVRPAGQLVWLFDRAAASQLPPSLAVELG